MLLRDVSLQRYKRGPKALKRAGISLKPYTVNMFNNLCHPMIQRSGIRLHFVFRLVSATSQWTTTSAESLSILDEDFRTTTPIHEVIKDG